MLAIGFEVPELLSSKPTMMYAYSSSNLTILLANLVSLVCMSSTHVNYNLEARCFICHGDKASYLTAFSFTREQSPILSHSKCTISSVVTQPRPLMLLLRQLQDKRASHLGMVDFDPDSKIVRGCPILRAGTCDSQC